MKHLLFALLLLLCGPLQAQYDSLNVQMKGHLNYGSLRLNDVWAYVDTSGHEWALVGTVIGLSIVDLDDPTDPQQAFFLPGDTTAWRDIKTWGHFAYVSNESGHGLRIVDLSDLPNSVNYKDTVIGGVTTIHNLWIDEYGYLYEAGDNVQQGLSILNLNPDPWNPVLTGSYGPDYVHDLYVRGNKAYIAKMNAGELGVLDVTDRSNVVTLGSQSYVNAVTHSTWLDSSGTVCFTADEDFYGYIYSWDVSNPSNIQRLDGIRSAIGAGTPVVPHNVTYHQGFLFNSYYEDGVQLVDAHRPGNLVQVGHYDTNPANGGGLFEGCWGIYPFLPSGYILATDITRGLFVLEFNFQRAAYLEGIVTDSNTTFPLSNANIEILGTGATELSDNFGLYATGMADSGSFTARASRFGYQSKDTVLQFSPGQITHWDPVLPQLPAVGLTIRVEDSLTGNPIPGVNVLLDTAGLEMNYVTAVNGEVSDPGFIAGTYQIALGKWGYLFKTLTVHIDAQNNHLVVELAPGYYDNFGFDLGWTTSGNATQGHWVRDMPVGTLWSSLIVNPGYDAPDDWKDQCYVTGNGGGGAYDDDVDGGRVVLSSPVMDLSGYQDPVFYFDWWFVCAGGSSFQDSMALEVDNGSMRRMVWGKRDRLNDFWTRTSVRMSDFLPPSSTVQFHVRVSDTLNDHAVEGGLDVFRVVDDPVTELVGTASPGSALQVFPNPSGEAFVLRCDLGAGQTAGSLRLLDLHGRQLFHYQLGHRTATVQFREELPRGMYIAVLESGGERLETVKVLRY